MSKTIRVNVTPDKVINLAWSNNDEFIRYFKRQRLAPFATAKDDYTNDIEVWINYWWSRIRRNIDLYGGLSDNAKILDVGCGSSFMDLIASEYNPTFEFYLLDKKEYSSYFTWFDTKHVFYHSWDIVKDLISTSSLNEEKFNFLNYDENWPNDLDLVTSFASWGFHYPIKNNFGYWEKVLSSLKVGGKLYLDISNNCLEKYPETLNLISDTFGSHPIKLLHYSSVTTQLLDNKNYIWKDNTFGQGCLWVRNK